MKGALDKLTIKGFKSIKDLENFKLNNLNIIVGANGAGKSNFISFFKMLRALIDGKLNKYASDNGGVGDILFDGRKVTEEMEFETHFGIRGFKFKIIPTVNDTCLIEDEARYYKKGGTGWWILGTSHDDTSIMVKEATGKCPDTQYSKFIYEAIASWQIYHFHDTSSNASMRHYEIIQDCKTLRTDASNIAPFLLNLRKNDNITYKRIVNAIRLVTPFFDDFCLDVQKFGESEKVRLSWQQKGSDFPMQPYHLSDGSIRFICLATALLQPNLPATIIFDEPEIGLHPGAIAILAELIESTATETQVIVATQSPALMDYFAIEDIVVVKRKDGASTFERLKEENFNYWLEEYTIGELWSKDVIAGGPSYE